MTTTQYQITFERGAEGMTLSHDDIEVDDIEIGQDYDVYTVTVPANWTLFEQMLDTDSLVVSYCELTADEAQIVNDCRANELADVVASEAKVQAAFDAL